MDKTILAAVTLVSTVSLASAQDTQFIAAIEAAQRGRPATLTSQARIAPESEPGTTLIIHGRALAADGRTPLANAVVFAYHTDKDGLYDRAGSPAHSWRLKGWSRTDADGRFEFRTIRPGSYPGTNNPPHVHFTLFTADGSRYHAGELQFQGSRGVRVEGGVEHVDHTVRPGQRF